MNWVGYKQGLGSAGQRCGIVVAWRGVDAVCISERGRRSEGSKGGGAAESPGRLK